MQIISFLLLISSNLILIQSQLQKPGRFRNLINTDLKKSWERNHIKEYILPEQDNAKLLSKVEAEEAADPNRLPKKQINKQDGTEEISFGNKLPKSQPFTFGKAIDLQINMTQPGEGEWIINEESQTKMWRFKVSSKEAHSISIYFADFHLSPLSELYILGREETIGAFTAKNNNKDDRTFAIAPIAGDFLILELIEPILPNDHPLYNYGQSSSIVVNHIVHAFRPTPFSQKALNPSGACNINVACPEGANKIDAINSVALLINDKGQSFCTGAMVNNVKQDGRQFFLTAEHCISNDDVKNFMFGFQYQFKYCNSMFEINPQTRTIHGAKLIGKSGVTDYALLEAIENIPDDWDVFMAGWDATPSTSRYGSFYGIHHPKGDTKKVSLYTGNLDLVRLTDINLGLNFWRVKKWNKGVTEPGSSGSPLFNSDGNVIGHLLGGDSSCSRPYLSDYYGSLNKDWIVKNNPIAQHLDPNNLKILKVTGAPLKQLNSNSRSIEKETPTAIIIPTSADQLTITVTATITKTTTVTTSIASTTKLITGQNLTKTITERTTITSTFTRVPPPITVTQTVTKKIKNNIN